MVSKVLRTRCSVLNVALSRKNLLHYPIESIFTLFFYFFVHTDLKYNKVSISKQQPVSQKKNKKTAAALFLKKKKKKIAAAGSD